MKTIVVEGHTDFIVMETLFPQMRINDVTIRIAQGFSNVFAVAKTLIDYGVEVLAVLDTDTRIPGNDNRVIMKRIQESGLAGRTINIVWMDSCIEDVLSKTNAEMFSKKARGVNLKQAVLDNMEALLKLDEFKQIQEFIEG